MTSSEVRDAELRALMESGQQALATTVILQEYGREILGFLWSLSHDGDLTSEAFSELTEDLWRGLPRFEWRCPLRAWLYVLARHAAIRVGRAARRQRRQQVSLAEAPDVAEFGDRVRTETLAYLRTRARDGLSRLRDRLPEEDRTVLLLRVDRKLGWTDIAHVTLHEPQRDAEEPPNAAALAREAARLRKRYQLIKRRLRHLAREEGLVP